MTVYFYSVLSCISARSFHDHDQHFIHYFFSIINKSIMNGVTFYFFYVFVSIFGTVDPGDHFHGFIATDPYDPDSGSTHGRGYCSYCFIHFSLLLDISADAGVFI